MLTRKGNSTRCFSWVLHAVVLIACLVEVGYCASRVLGKDGAKLKKSLSGGSSASVAGPKTPENSPRLGVCERNFAGRDVRVIAETGGGLPAVLDATLPVLKVEDHIWDGKSIQLTCNASYPVKIEYNGPGMPVVKIETYRKAPVFDDPKTYTYAVSVIFSHTSEQQSGNYTCRSVKEPAVSSSIYLFVPGEHVFIGDSVTPANETILVRAKERDQRVLLPCATSVKNSNVRLFKILTGGHLQEVPLSESVTYHVASGFSLKWRGPGAMSEPWGNYLCRVSGDRYEKIHLRLVPPQQTVKPAVPGDTEENQLTYDRESVTGSSKLRITFSEENDMIECCSTDKKLRPKMKIAPCTSTNDCQMARRYLERSCDLHKSADCDNFVDHTSRGCVGYPLATGSVSEGGILQCMVDESETVFMQFSYGAGGMVSDFTTMPQTSKILNIGREDTRNSTVGRYYCDASQFFFSHGLKWALKKLDGKVEFVPETRFPQRPILEVNESQVKEVICYAPVWDSPTEWRSASMNTPK